MRIGFSVFLMAVGAILLFAVHKTATGVNIHTIGLILIIAGVIGLAATLTVFAPRRGVTGVASERTVTTDAPAVPVAAAPVATPVTTTTTTPVAPAPAGVTTQQVVEHREVY
ncbi:MAG TPA: hypothetical protein VFG00_02680 [Acidothermaceae bacterium]|nr:hypothetical protein [Acidothermaceae bacterium]